MNAIFYNYSIFISSFYPYLFFHFCWIYWCDTVWQNYTGFRWTTHHLYTILCIHHPKSSLYPPTFILLCPPPTLPHQPPRFSNHHTFVILIYLNNSKEDMCTPPPCLNVWNLNLKSVKCHKLENKYYTYNITFWNAFL